MALEQKDYAKCRMWVDGDFMVEVTSVSKQTNSGNIPVHLLNEGLAGFTDGSGDINITFGYVVPASGIEFDFANAAVERGYHTVQFTMAGKSAVFRGKFMNDDVGQSVDAATAGTAAFMGSPKLMK